MHDIKKEITIDAPVAVVWEHLTDREKLAGWMLMENDFRPEIGADFVFRAGKPEGWDGIIRCNVVELDPHRRLAFTWTWQLLGVETLVRIDLEERSAGTHVTLTHTGWEGLTEEQAELPAMHDEGWQLRVCEKLPQQVEGAVG